jgi:hypothetical protein
MEAYRDEWSDLDDYLKDLVMRLKAEAYRLFDSKNVQLLPFVDNIHSWEQIESASRAFRDLFGETFLSESGDRHHLHQESGNNFIAEPLLSAYTLIVAFSVDTDFEQSGVLWLLEKARPTLCELIRRLPPHGGPRALSQVQRAR